MRRTQQIEALLEELSPDELLALIEHIARRLRLHEERKPQPLHGIWREKFPEDADIRLFQYLLVGIVPRSIL